jgi:hypothetical protein
MRYQLTVLDQVALRKVQIGGIRQMESVTCPSCRAGTSAASGWYGKKLAFAVMCNCGFQEVIVSQEMKLEPWQQMFAFQDFERDCIAKLKSERYEKEKKRIEEAPEVLPKEERASLETKGTLLLEED